MTNTDPPTVARSPTQLMNNFMGITTQWKFKQKNDLADERDMKVYAFHFHISNSTLHAMYICLYEYIQYTPTTEVNITYV